MVWQIYCERIYLYGSLLSLNIKNEETYQLAREFAALTGESMTGAITVGL